MKHYVKLAAFALFVRPLVLLMLGLNVRHRERLPLKGPAIIAANHNSHLDTLVLMSLFPLDVLAHVRPAAAADYFLANRWIAWIATHVLDIIPVERADAQGLATSLDGDPLAGPAAALENGDIVILFPEGTRGAPEARKPLKSGMARLQQRVPKAPIVPLFLHGLGKALPKGSWLPVPFYCDIAIGEPVAWPGSRPLLMEQYRASMAALEGSVPRPTWE